MYPTSHLCVVVHFLIFLPSATVVVERLCFLKRLSFCPGEGGARQTPTTPRPGRPPPTREDGHCSGRYASYWNAFLFFLLLKLPTRKLTRQINSLHDRVPTISDITRSRHLLDLYCRVSGDTCLFNIDFPIVFIQCE